MSGSIQEISNQLDNLIEENNKRINELLSKSNIEDVDAESNERREDLEDGYYLCSVDKAEITESKSSGNPMIAFTFTVEDGKKAIADENGDAVFEEVKNCKNRKVFKYYVLKDEASVKRFVSDMLKFEGEEVGVPLLEKDYFTNSEVLADALDILAGSKIYIQVSSSEKEDGTKSTWQNLLSWKRATLLGLSE